MKRYAFAMKVRPGKHNSFRCLLGYIWDEVTAFLDRNEIRNFSLWTAEDLVFGYYETADEKVFDEEERQAAAALTGEVHAQSRRIAWHN